MPLFIPLIAGPGAIVTTISIASRSDAIEPLVAALIGAVVVALAASVASQWLGGAIAWLSQNATALIVGIGGLILATIRVQTLLDGLKNFFVASASCRPPGNTYVRIRRAYVRHLESWLGRKMG